MIFKRQGFSLIEIMQTVILMGIIAGLSISFFRRVNVDERLYYATEKQLAEAILEAERQMCNDSTPVCANALWVNNCSAIYLNSTYNEITNNCELTVAADAACPAPSDANATPMIKLGTRCYAPPQCPEIDDEGNITNYFDASTYSSVQCNNPNAINLNLTSIYDANATELCYRLHSLINHKRQGDNDLLATCATAVDSCLFATTEADSCQTKNNRIDNANMILPNGVRLYNLSGIGKTAPASGNSTNIIIKYDRFPDIATVVSGTLDADDNTTINTTLLNTEGKTEETTISSINALSLTVDQLKAKAPSIQTSKSTETKEDKQGEGQDDQSENQEDQTDEQNSENDLQNE